MEEMEYLTNNNKFVPKLVSNLKIGEKNEL